MIREKMTKILFGVTMLILGVLFFLVAVGLLNYRDVYPFWTLFLIVPTIGSMIANGVTFWKTLLLALSVNALIIQLNWGNDWGYERHAAVNFAVFLIMLGIYLVFGNSKKKRVMQGDQAPPYIPPQAPYSSSAENQTQGTDSQANNQARWEPGQRYAQGDYNPKPGYVAVLSSNTYTNYCQGFKGGSATAVLGSIEVDLSNIRITHDVDFEVTAVLGGADVYVPRNVRIETDGVGILGGCDNFVTQGFGMEVPRLRIKYNAILGGVNVKIR
ncbi:MAG: hypothetical protein FWF05_05675 [Oscillospiraceae bacterium]|nr:hypothetical protein [Oscillospiraceae bacterium]